MLLLTCLCFLSFFQHLLLDLLLGLDILVILLQFLPTKLLVLKHVLDQLLNTLADDANIGLSLFRCIPDGAELFNDGLVFLVTEFAFTFVAFAALLQFFLNSHSDFLKELDGSLNSVIHKGLWVE